MNTPATIGEYMAAFNASLEVGLRSRRRIFSEVAGHLWESAQARVRAGMDPHHAWRETVAAFGTPEEVAAAFESDAAAALDKRVAVTARRLDGWMARHPWGGAALRMAFFVPGAAAVAVLGAALGARAPALAIASFGLVIGGIWALRREEPQLDPFPDRLLDEPGPEASILERESVELAFVAAVQVLPPRQRGVLLLRDVLGWSAKEVAELLGTTVASVNSALQRARSTLEREREAGLVTKAHSPPASEVERQLVRRFVKAWEATDVDGLVRLLAEDAILTMPPLPLRVAGSGAIGEFLRTRPAGGQLHRFRLVETRANRRPAVALYLDGDAHALMALALDGERIAALTRFGEPQLFPRFGLAMSYRAPDGSINGTATKESS